MGPSDRWGVVAEPVRLRRLTDQEGQKVQQIVHRGSLCNTESGLGPCHGPGPQVSGGRGP